MPSSNHHLKSLSMTSMRDLKENTILVSFSLLAEDNHSILDSIQLTDQECDRYEQYMIPSGATQFLLSRSYLRLIIAQLLDCDANTITFETTEKGKLYLKDQSLFFNISHSHQRGVIALSLDPMIGIDLEYHRIQKPYESIAKRFFTERETHWLLQQPLDYQHPSFFDIWTGKEAVSKSTGLGLSINFASFSVLPIYDLISTTLANNHPLFANCCFYLHYLTLFSNYSCCISTATLSKPILHLELHPEPA